MLKILASMLIVFSASLSAQTQEYSQYYNQVKELSSSLLSILDSNRDRIIGIEYLSASGTSESVMSRFGHSMLRFVDNDNDYTNDIVLSFEADIPDGIIDYGKGLTGVYSIYPRLDFLVNFWERYVRGENRPLERFIIPTNDIMLNALIDELVKVSEDVSLLDTYTFLNRNCAGILAQIFLNSGISTKSKGLNARVPVLFDNWLSGSLLTPYQSIRSLSPQGVFDSVRKLFKLDKNILINDYSKWPSNSVDLLRAKLTNTEILFLYRELWDMPVSLSDELIKGIKYTNSFGYQDVVGMKVLPSKIYKLCESMRCAYENIQNERNIWGEEISLNKSNWRKRRYLNAVYRKVKERGSVLYTYKERKDAFQDNEYLQAIRKNYEKLILANENIIKEKK